MRRNAFAAAGCAWLAACGPGPSTARPQAPAQTSAAAARSANAETELPDPLASVAPTADGWYDATPLLIALRPALRPAIRELAGLAKLEQLPLYDLRLSLDPLAGTFDLDEELYFTNTEDKPLEEVVLRLWANTAGKTESGQPKAPKVLVARTGCTTTPCEIRVDSPSTLTVRPQSPLAPGARLRVALTLRGVLGRIDPSRTDMLSASLDSLLSLGKEGSGDYGLLSTGEGIALYANGMAVLARRTPQGWDRAEAGSIGDIGSDDMANVRARVELPASVDACTVGTAVSTSITRTQGDVRRVVHVAAPLVRDFTVVAGTGLGTTSTSVGDVLVRSMYRTADAASGARVAATASQAIEVFERRFGMYPYAELDACEAALIGGAGGVEFSGLVAIASMFYHQEADSPLGKLFGELQGKGLPELSSLTGPMLEFVTVHEVAHQWWHGLVGSDSRQHPFLDESLAQYASVLFLEERYGAEKARGAADQNVRMNYQMMRLMGIDDAAVDRPASAFGSSMAYAGLVYGKGPYFYERARKVLGDEAFFDALRRYVKEWQFRVAPADGPIRQLARGPKEKEIEALARRWLKEAHGDQDLGRADMSHVMSGMLGGQGQGMSMDPDTLKQLLEMLKSGGSMLDGF
jgi:hypothetical protein